MEGFKKLPKYKAGGLIKTPVTGDKKAAAPSKAAVKAKDVGAKTVKPSGHKDPYIKSKESGKAAFAPSAAAKGRAKKSVGTVKKFKSGGCVNNVYEAKKSAGDKDNIKKTKDITPSKAAAPSGAKGPDAYKKGGKIKKMADGRSTGPTPRTPVRLSLADLEKQRQMDKIKRALTLGPAQATQLINQDPSAAGLTPPPAPTPAPAMQAPGGVSPAGAIPMQKRGGKVKKYATGGSIDDDVRSRAMKWIEAGSPPQNQDDAETPTKSAPKKAETKLYPPDMTIEEADRQNTEYENKRESQRLARRYPEKRSPAKMIRDEAEIAQPSSMETKGNRLLKSSGIRLHFKRGGKAC